MASREYHRNYSRNYYHVRKKELQVRLGGKCVVCGATEKLTFDHIDPAKKSFNISHLLNRSKDETDSEVSKCQLLCRGCHLDKSKREGSFSKNKLRGEQVRGSILKEVDVRDIRRMLSCGVRGIDLARRFKVSKDTIYAISKGAIWKHVI